MTETPSTPVLVGEVPTPVGPLRVAERDGRVVALAFADQFERVAAPVRRRFPGPWIDGEPRCLRSLERYVAGDLAALEQLDVDVDGSAFRRQVWTSLRAIPVGETRSYADIARDVGAPTAVRAVGSANGANPVWLIVPCHRVVRSDGALGGYGGGVERKRWLLRHEGARTG